MSMLNPGRSAAHRHRQGAVMIAALVCLLLVSMLVTSMLQSALNSRRQIRTEMHARQTILLMQAGASRAQDQLAKDDSYDGETLHLKIPARSGTEQGEIVILTEPDGGQSQVRVQVTARYPLDSLHMVQRTCAFTIPQSTR